MGATTAADAPFSRSETVAWPELQAMQLKLLHDQLAWLFARSAFYQRKLAATRVAAGDIRTLDDLRRIPFTTKQELRDSLQAAPLLGLHQAADWADIVQVQASSGTTG